ncbi:V-type proton ATPase subunit C 1-B-like isoform X1 [Actinia tenebrosa]|uniref:V-type proton ATPase subunit C n=1 Tax=Actinia tenebrosa TaxID=6105 RepID=A0A6P8I469_ACTTE|nr:V-type proton ATPase subunit C 1-B-like isoform X1 [Actinia tenebrosa]
MAEYWLVSAPGEKTPQQTFEALKARMIGLSPVWKFSIPELKVGTLDTLVGLSDDLNKLDLFVDSVTRKVAHYMVDVLEEHQDRVKENLLANGQELSNYVTKFQWDTAKYPIKQSLRNITEIISKQVTQIEHDLKSKALAYNNIKGTLASLERKSTGSLLTRNLGELVKKEHFVLDSEYLTTLLVVVPKVLFGDWKNKYWKLTDMVVPESTKLVFEDNEHGLFTVTLFRKVIDEFKLHARDNKFLVRDFVYDEKELEAGKNEISKLETTRKKQFVSLQNILIFIHVWEKTILFGYLNLGKIFSLSDCVRNGKRLHPSCYESIIFFYLFSFPLIVHQGPLVRWLRVNFSEAFTAWIHVKALTVFVESVLRYGLPVNFQAMLIQPSKKTQKKIRDVLSYAYSHLESTSYNSDINDLQVDIPGLIMAQQEYFPYVFYQVKLNLLDK